MRHPAQVQSHILSILRYSCGSEQFITVFFLPAR